MGELRTTGRGWPMASVVDEDRPMFCCMWQIALAQTHMGNQGVSLCRIVVGFEDSGDIAVQLNSPQGGLWDPCMGFYVMADTWNHRIQSCVAAVLRAPCHTGTANLSHPRSVAMDGNGDHVIIHNRFLGRYGRTVNLVS